MSNIYIFTEAGGKLGYGHLTRCRALATEIKKQGYNVIFIINGSNENNLKSMLSEDYFILKKWYDKKYISRVLKENDYAIIDSYIADKNIYNYISQNCKKVLYIDDTNRLDYPDGIVLNPSVSGSKLNYKPSNNKIYLYGSKYILLRSAFQNLNIHNIKKDNKQILVTFGGSDPKNLTPKVLKILVEYFPDFEKKVIIGNDYDNIHKIKKLKDNKTKFLSNLEENEMKNIMLESDLAITGAGQTIYELIITKTPFLAIQVAENQKYNIEFLENQNFTTVTEVENFKNKIINFITKKPKKVPDNIIDGKGAKRVISIFLSTFKLRYANKNDIKKIFNLSNKDYVRKFSINKEKISWEEHKTWFSNVLENPNFVFYIIQDEDENFLGQIRFEIKKESAKISLSFTEKLKGKGLAKFILSKALNKFRSEKPDVKKIIAFINPNNKASQKLFASLNFKHHNIKNKQSNFEKYIYTFNS